MLQGPVQHIGHDLHVLVPVRREPSPRRHAVVVDDPQRAETHVAGVVPVGEREAVPRVEPAVVGVAPRLGGSQGDHGGPLWGLGWWAAWACLARRR